MHLFIHYTLYIIHYLVHRDLSLDDGSGLITHLSDSVQHLLSLTERAVVTHAADPSGRIEVNIYVLRNPSISLYSPHWSKQNIP